MAARAQERILIDHDEIRRWAEERGAVPARVKGTGGADDTGILRLHFPQFSQNDEKLEEISWDDFFKEFDRKKLALLVEDRMPDGRISNFNKIISRSTIEDFRNSRDLSSTRRSNRVTPIRGSRQKASTSSPRRTTTRATKRKTTAARSGKKSSSGGTSRRIEVATVRVRAGALTCPSERSILSKSKDLHFGTITKRVGDSRRVAPVSSSA